MSSYLKSLFNLEPRHQSSFSWRHHSAFIFKHLLIHGSLVHRSRLSTVEEVLFSVFCSTALTRTGWDHLLSLYWHCPLILSSAVVDKSRSITKNEILGNGKNRSWGYWVQGANTTSVLWSPSGIVIFTFHSLEKKWSWLLLSSIEIRSHHSQTP